MDRQEFAQLAALRNEDRQCRERIMDLERKLQYRHIVDSVEGSTPDYPYVRHTIRIEGEVDETSNAAIRRAISKQLDISRALRIRIEYERTRLLGIISDIPDSLVRQTMTLRYVDGRTWREVASLMGYASEDVPRMMAYRFLHDDDGR